MDHKHRNKSWRDPYAGIVVIFLAAIAFGLVLSLVSYLELRSPLALLMCTSLMLAGGIVGSVLQAQMARSKAGGIPARDVIHTDAPKDVSAKTPRRPFSASALSTNMKQSVAGLKQRLRPVRWSIAPLAGIVGAIAALVLLAQRNFPLPSNCILVGGSAGVFLLGAALAMICVRYLTQIDAALFPEAPGLARGARVLSWIFILAALAIGCEWFHLPGIARGIYYLVLAIEALLSVELIRSAQTNLYVTNTFPLNFVVLSGLGRRANILASILDSGEQQFGIDLRSTWALTLVRRSLEPLVLCLLLAGWLSTSLTVVGLEEKGLLERFGVPSTGPALEPGLHVHLPWPMDQIFRIPVQKVRTVQVGHEGDEPEGPENVLWAVEHAPNEFTLLLGNGRDLITVDAAVGYRIRDAHAWRYSVQNPDAALKAIAYRTVMHSTVNLTLSEALSQNVGILTSQMRDSVQKDADDLHLGVEILAFTVGGMHPPVPVAAAYEAVVSAQLKRATDTVNAQAYRNSTVPTAEAEVLAGVNTAKAQGADALALAAGKAWSFRALEAQYHAAPAEYNFRRRLETLEQTLPKFPYIVVDSRFLRDGGEIWTTH
jgi:regulator of protease activity HflC (stomatin/prohibitin superfamily)